MPNSSEGTTTIELSRIVAAMSLALDLAEPKQLEHARKVTYVATALAKTVQRNIKADEVYFAAMLHDIGITGHFDEMTEGAEQTNDNVRLHPIKGSEIVAQLPCLESISQVIAAHHERWDGQGYPYGISANEIPIESRIIFLADRFDAKCHEMGQIRPQEIKNWLAQNTGTMFDPYLAIVLAGLADTPKFLLDYTCPYLDLIVERQAPKRIIEVSSDELAHLGKSFSILIDNKSSYTANHSKAVAYWSELLGRELGFDELTISKLKVAALLHDMGKMAVPTRVLDKPESLTHEELDLIKTHPYYTELILGEFGCLNEIAEWASMHHERLDGSGYPNKLGSEKIPLQARIIAIADVFEALISDRPYRKRLSFPEAVKVLQEEGRWGRLDHQLVNSFISVLERSSLSNT